MPRTQPHPHPLSPTQDVAHCSTMSNGSGEFQDICYRNSAAESDDATDGRTANAERIKKEAYEHLQNKMMKTRDLIKQEQKSRDGELAGL